MTTNKTVKLFYGKNNALLQKRSRINISKWYRPCHVRNNPALKTEILQSPHTWGKGKILTPYQYLLPPGLVGIHDITLSPQVGTSRVTSKWDQSSVFFRINQFSIFRHIYFMGTRVLVHLLLERTICGQSVE